MRLIEREACHGCEFLEYSDRSVKNESIEEGRRKAGKKKGPIKCVVRLIEREVCHECEKVRGISSGGADMGSHHQGKETNRSQYQEAARGSLEKVWNGFKFLERKRAAVAGRIASHIEAWEKAGRIIEHAGDERARLLLYYRFILGYPWEKIQKRLGVAAAQVHCIKRDALRAVAACND